MVLSLIPLIVALFTECAIVQEKFDAKRGTRIILRIIFAMLLMITYIVDNLIIKERSKFLDLWSMLLDTIQYCGSLLDFYDLLLLDRQLKKEKQNEICLNRK